MYLYTSDDLRHGDVVSASRDSMRDAVDEETVGVGGCNAMRWLRLSVCDGE